MAGLMMVFLFISVAFMRYVMIEQDRVQEIVTTYHENQEAIYQSLLNEFKDDLTNWNAQINRQSLEFEFRSPDVLFEVGQTTLNPQFREVLNDFYPRYVHVLSDFRNSIDEIRIEGHTSSDWAGVVGREAYFRNMELSQGRTRAVLEFFEALELPSTDRNWMKRHIAAVGYSSSRLILDAATGEEDRSASRRVNFRVMTNAALVQLNGIL